MEAMLLIVAIIVIFAYCIYKCTKLLKMTIDWKSLVLCALCALLINSALPIVTRYSKDYHLHFIIAALLLSAYGITLFNQKATRRTSGESASIAGNSGDFIIPAMNVAYATVSTANEFHAAEREATPSLWQQQSEAVVSGDDEPVIDADHDLPVDMTLAAAIQDSDNAVIELYEPSHIGVSTVQTPDSDEQAVSGSKPEEPAAAPPKLPDKPRSSEPLADNVKVKLSQMTSLTEVLDYVITLREHDYTDSMAQALRYALNTYSDDDYAPFIAIELGNIYKNAGFYAKAIAVYEQALFLPSVAKSTELKDNFHKNISYLRIVIKTLASLYNFSDQTPFSEIPEPVLQEIELTFQHWRMKKYAS